MTSPSPTTTHKFYGRRASFPFELGVKGGIRESAGDAAVEESMRVILGTRHGERVMRPTFGCNLHSLAFAPNNEATASLARHYVTAGLTAWEPRVELLDVGVENDNEDGRLMIRVHYRIKETQAAGTLVYPFYLGAA